MRSAVIATGLCLSLTGPCFAQTPTAAMARVETHIPPQALESALKQLETLDHMRVLYLDAAVDNVRTSGASGYLTADETLTRLLSGTGLKYRYVDANAVSLISSPPKENVTQSASLPSKSLLQSHKIHDKPPGATAAPTDPPVIRKQLQTKYTNDTLSEVVVTAQKFRQSALDVPISLVVIGSDQLLEQHIETLNDLQYYVPGLRVEGGGAQQRIIIRGVGNEYGDGAYVSEYLDDADVTAAGYSAASGLGGTNLQTYDLARVEVLRGPQGTLYGDGALGGTIRLITNAPVLDEFQMSSNVELPFTQYGAPSQDVDVMLNSPIAPDLALRVAGEFRHDGGWIDEPLAGVKNINADNLTDARIEGLWAPSSHLKVKAMQIIHREAYGLGQGEDANGDFTQAFNSATVPNAQKNFDLSNVTVTYDFSRIRLLNSSTYLSSAEELHNETDIVPGAAIATTSYVLSPERKYTEELRLAGNEEGPWRWLVGGFYDRDRSAAVDGPEYLGLYSIPRTLSSLASAIHSPGGGAFLQGSDSWAAFGDASYRFAGRLTVGAGVRYYKDLEMATGYPNGPSNATFTSTDPRIYIEDLISPHVNVYASAAKGFRTGGFNPYTTPYGPESLWNYELGTKMQVADNRLAVNLDVFWSDYSKYLGFAIVPSVSPLFGETYNIGDARIRGAEGDATWRPNSDWLFSVSGSYLDAKIISIAASAFDASYKVGDEVPLSSKYQFTSSMERDFQWKERQGYARVTYAQLSPQIIYEPLGRSDLIRMLGLDLGINWTENLKLGLFAQNLLNDRGLLDPFGPTDTASRPRPRTYGLDFSVLFKER